MTVTDFKITWFPERVPKDIAGVEEILEASGVWELVHYAAGVRHSVTGLTVIKDGRGVAAGELVISFSPCKKGFIESEVRSYITSQVVRSLPGKTGRNKRAIGEGESGEIVSRRGRCPISSKRVFR